MEQERLKPHQQALLLAGIVVVLVWLLPYAQWILLPFQYLNTHLHELSHALMGVLTGGEPTHIEVYANGGGVTPVAGGSLLLTASAGYVGTAAIGGAMIYGSRTERGARAMLYVAAGFLAFSLIVWVRGTLTGYTTAAAWIAVLVLMARYMQGFKLLFAAQVLGMLLAFASVQSVYALLQISMFGGHSDAALLAQHTGIPAMVWAVMWMITSFVLVTIAVRHAWKGTTVAAASRLADR